jgi:hypothetical protein
VIDRCERAPDKFMRREYVHGVNAARQRLADLVNCDVDDLVVYV